MEPSLDRPVAESSRRLRGSAYLLRAGVEPDAGEARLTGRPARGVSRSRGHSSDTVPAMAKLTVRVDLKPGAAVGPGKIRLLELIGESGSISAAGRSMGMSYRRAWTLVAGINRLFREPAVETQLGGTRGGGAALTRFG